MCVLLDPTWGIENRTKTFELVFEQLCVSKAPQISDDHVFINIVRILGSSEILEYVNTLLGTALSVQ